MWLLTTRNRPEMCQRALNACIETGVTTPGLVWMDGCDYGPMRMPRGWMQVSTADHRNIGRIMREFYKVHPDLSWYGWMADDCIPVTMRWDEDLIEAAGNICVSYPNDHWQRGVKERDGSPHVTSIVCMGGELVRAMGFWVLPDQIQMYIDDVWESIAVPLDLMRYRKDVVCEHHHFVNGKRPRDATDTRQFNGVSFPAHDLNIYRGWLASPQYEATMSRVSQLKGRASLAALQMESSA